MNMNKESLTPQTRCVWCSELRSIPLHLFELSLYCDLLENERPVFERSKKKLNQVGEVRTNTIAKWLRLAAQVDDIVINAHIFQVADMYCESVNDALNDEAKHHQELTTPLTRLIFVFNALEESYRLLSQRYEESYELRTVSKKSTKYLRSYSAQAAYVIRTSMNTENKPLHYEHLVNNLEKVFKKYLDEFKGRIDLVAEDKLHADYGLGMVRNLRNHIVHGIFPIIDDPDYSFYPNGYVSKRNLISLLQRATRLAALNIQIILHVANNPFESDGYSRHIEDDEYGQTFYALCNSDYLKNIHIINSFGLNEESYFSMLDELTA